MGKIFVSHSSKDREFVESQIMPVIRSVGAEPWYSGADIAPAAEWQRAILSGLRESAGVIAVISRNAIGSEWVRSEVDWAFREREGRIIPALIGGVPGSVEELHIKLPRVQMIDFREPGGRALEMLASAIQSVCSTLPQDPRADGLGREPGTECDRDDSAKVFFPRLGSSLSAEIRFQISRAREHWQNLEDRFLDDLDLGKLMGRRTDFCDELTGDIAEMIRQTGTSKLDGISIIARGGYGKGLLSAGSDIDLAVIQSDRNVGVEFCSDLSVGIGDVLGSMQGIRSAEAIPNTLAELHQQWAYTPSSSGRKSLAPLISFNQTRLVFGDARLHEDLRSAWIDFVKSLDGDELRAIRNKIGAMIADKPIDPDAPSFDLKGDGGGLLEITLALFLISVAQLRGTKFPGFDVASLNVQRDFLLRVREASFLNVRAPRSIIHAEELVSCAATLTKLDADGVSTQELKYRLTRSRRKIRSYLEILLRSDSGSTIN